MDNYCDAVSGTCVFGCRESDPCKECGVCNNMHLCVEPECCNDSDCQDEYNCLDGSCQEVCQENGDCAFGNYCDNGFCKEGCTDNTMCENCGECNDHECTYPECCSDSDCASDKPICSSDNACVPGCQTSDDCEGSDEVCNEMLSNCAYCDNLTHRCLNGCDSNYNCDGFHCDNSHSCKSGLSKIKIETYTCTGCQGSMGDTDEDGPYVILEGASGITCNTIQLDNPSLIDFDNGKTITFTTKDLLQTCFKADLDNTIIEGSIHWTASQGEWVPKRQQIKFGWSNDEKEYCCCLSVAALSSSDPIAKFTDCGSCSFNCS